MGLNLKMGEPGSGIGVLQRLVERDCRSTMISLCPLQQRNAPPESSTPVLTPRPPRTCSFGPQLPRSVGTANLEEGTTQDDGHECTTSVLHRARLDAVRHQGRTRLRHTTIETFTLVFGPGTERAISPSPCPRSMTEL